MEEAWGSGVFVAKLVRGPWPACGRVFVQNVDESLVENDLSYMSVCLSVCRGRPFNLRKHPIMEDEPYQVPCHPDTIRGFRRNVWMIFGLLQGSNQTGGHTTIYIPGRVFALHSRLQVPTSDALRSK